MIDRALAKNPDDRYPTSGNMAADFLLAAGLTEKPKTTWDELPAQPKNTLIDIPAEAEKVLVDLPGASTAHSASFVKAEPAGRKRTRMSLAILSGISLLALAAVTIAIGAIFHLSQASQLIHRRPAIDLTRHERLYSLIHTHRRTKHRKRYLNRR